MKGPIVFYDGECGLCDRAVQFLIRIDRDEKLRFATLQGETAHQLLGIEPGQTEFGTMVLVDSAGTHYRSSAALRSAAHAGRGWILVRGFLIIPAFIRDAVYGVVSRNRLRFFGRVDSCQLPSPALRTRFLP